MIINTMIILYIIGIPVIYGFLHNFPDKKVKDRAGFTSIIWPAFVLLVFVLYIATKLANIGRWFNKFI